MCSSPDVHRAHAERSEHHLVASRTIYIAHGQIFVILLSPWRCRAAVALAIIILLARNAEAFTLMISTS